MKKMNKKSGFTLVELMIVAAIIAILAAIVIPLLASNKDRAIAAEAANICGAVMTEAKVIQASTGSFPTDVSPTLKAEINQGRYFTYDDNVTLDGTNTVEVAGDGTDGSAGKGFSTGQSENLKLTVGAGYSGSMVTEKWIAN